MLTLFFDGSGTIVDIEEPRWLGPLPPDLAKDVTIDTEFRLPFDGIWWAAAGGPTEPRNHHVVAPADGIEDNMRWACHFPSLATSLMGEPAWDDSPVQGQLIQHREE